MIRSVARSCVRPRRQLPMLFGSPAAALNARSVHRAVNLDAVVVNELALLLLQALLLLLDLIRHLLGDVVLARGAKTTLVCLLVLGRFFHALGALACARRTRRATLTAASADSATTRGGDARACEHEDGHICKVGDYVLTISG